jgi:hypothetical protein
MNLNQTFKAGSQSPQLKTGSIICKFTQKVQLKNLWNWIQATC